jgi:hypothetical protein
VLGFVEVSSAYLNRIQKIDMIGEITARSIRKVIGNFVVLILVLLFV